MKVTIKRLEEEDLMVMAREMRDIDRLEAEAMSGGLDPAEALMRAGSISTRGRAGYADDQLIAVWGIAAPTLLSSKGSPWLIASDAVYDKDVRRAFLRHSKREFSTLIDGYRHLSNFVHQDNCLSIRWLKWLGFDFNGFQTMIGGEPFVYFSQEVT